MSKKQKTKSMLPEQKANYERLQKMIKKPENPFAEKIKELEKLLTKRNQAVPLKETAQIIGTGEQGIRDMRASYRNPDLEIEIFSKTEGKKEIWYVKIKKKKQP